MFIEVDVYDYKNSRWMSELVNLTQVKEIIPIDEALREGEREHLKLYPDSINLSPIDSSVTMRFINDSMIDVRQTKEEIQQLIRKEKMSIYN